MYDEKTLTQNLNDQQILLDLARDDLDQKEKALIINMKTVY